MNSIREWLQTLGLEEYVERFEREQIDLETVRHLSDADFRELGLPLGPRVKLRMALESRPPAPGAERVIPVIEPPAPGPQVERRVGMNNRPASLVVAIFLWLIALAQLLRVLFRVDVRAGDVSIPLWVSILAFIVLAALGIWLWRERRE